MITTTTVSGKPGQAPTLESAGHTTHADTIATAREWRQTDGATAMAALLDRHIPIDGVVCFNDSLALGALHTLATRGIHVPDDIAVTGFDNIPASEFANPSLSTIEPGRAQIARLAIDLLAQRIEHGPRDQPREIVTDYSLIVRKST